MSDMTQDFDGLVIEPIKGYGDISFKRADMAYWSGWATALKNKRLLQLKAEIEKNAAGIQPLAKAQALASAQNASVQIFELLDQQYAPDGIAKILKDAYVNAGGDAAKWPEIVKRIGPGRQQRLASEICSEPKPTAVELRESLREMLRKANRSAQGIDKMSDEELIAAAREFQPPPDKEGSDNPLAGSPSDDET